MRTVIREGFPNEKHNLPVALRPYWDARHQLAIDENDDMIVFGARIVLPKSMVNDDDARGGNFWKLTFNKAKS